MIIAMRPGCVAPQAGTPECASITAAATGVPGFNPIQDYANYDVRTHHTNMDTVDRLQIEDIRQAALVMAWFAYQAAMADQKLPAIRK